MWSSIRSFLNIPKELTGKDTKVAIIDGNFPLHPDIISNQKRDTYIVNIQSNPPLPVKLTSIEDKTIIGSHGLWTASAAGGSGQFSNGKYTGVAPEMDMYLIETGSTKTMEELEVSIGASLKWVKAYAREYGIKAVVLTVIGQRDTGLLPWQVDPLRILCEEIASQGILVVVASGNNHELTSSSVISPSVLSVGGVVIPFSGLRNEANPFLGSRGCTFEGKWNPDVLAPAKNVVLPYPFLSEQERLNHYTVKTDNLPSGYARQWGTSYAAPIVLGFAACIWQRHPNWTAEQVKNAITLFVEHNSKWDNLKAGLISIDFILNKVPSAESAKDESLLYKQWLYWKKRSLKEKIVLIDSNAPEILQVLLSFLPEKIPSEVIHKVKKLLTHPSPKVRTAAMCVLCTQPSVLTSFEITQCLNDNSPNVKMSGLYGLSLCPMLWESFYDSITDLINDENTDIRYNACKLASRMKSKQFVYPLISGMQEDAHYRRIGIFGQRMIALETITGIEIKREPEWREGENPYSKSSIEALFLIAEKWRLYASSKRYLEHM